MENQTSADLNQFFEPYQVEIIEASIRAILERGWGSLTVQFKDGRADEIEFNATVKLRKGDSGRAGGQR